MASPLDVLLPEQFHVLQVQLDAGSHPHVLDLPLHAYELSDLRPRLSYHVPVLLEPHDDVWATVPGKNSLHECLPRQLLIVPSELNDRRCTETLLRK